MVHQLGHDRTTIIGQLGYDWLPIGTQAPNLPSFTTKWINRRGAIIFHKITYRKIVQSNRGQVHVRTWNVISCTLSLILIWIRGCGTNKFTIENLRVGGTHAKSNDVLRVRANEINIATPLVIVSSLYMHQLVKSMVNWNMYNDNTMTSDVAYLKNSRSSLWTKKSFLFKLINIHIQSLYTNETVLVRQSEYAPHGLLFLRHNFI